jgi:hypothetical protein
MFTYQDSKYRGEVRLKESPMGNFELVSPEGQLVVVGSKAGELVDLVELTSGLKWEQEGVDAA